MRNDDWNIEIKPKVGLFDFNFREIWHYKDLIQLFVKRDFIAQYKQTILGPLWHIIQPIITTITYLILFNGIAKIPTDGIHPIVFYMSGITIWTYFSSCLLGTSNTFIANAGIFGKVYFPRLVTPISIIISNLVKFFIQLFILTVLIVWFSFNGFPIGPTINLFYLPILVAIFGFLGLGLGIIISSLTTKYRDFAVLLSFGVQLLMYATPIAYPLSYLQDSGYAWIIQWNPLSPLVEAFKFILLGQGTFDANGLLYSFIFTFVVLFVGAVMFNKVEKSFMDTV